MPAEPGRRRLDRLVLVVLLALVAGWGGLLLARSSFVLAGTRYFCLFDDAMISMAYAAHAAAGDGLVWTPGSEPVEGFTNPLWTAAMVPLHWLPLDRANASAAVQALGLLLVLATVCMARRLLLRHHHHGRPGPGAWLPAGVLIGSCYFFVYWSVMGMETPLQALLVLAALYLAYEVVYSGKPRTLALFAVLAAAYLVRMDMALLIVLVLVWTAFRGGFRRAERRDWLLGAALLAAAVAGYEVFRLLYFGDWLPNTYHLKVASVPAAVRVPRGLHVLGVFAREHWLLLAALAAAAAAGWRRRDDGVLLPAAVVAAYLAYSAWVGGDAWELPGEGFRSNRFVAFALPAAFVAVNDLLHRATQRLAPAAQGFVLAAATLLLVVQVNGLAATANATANRRLVLHRDRPPLVGSHAQVLHELLRFQERVRPGARVVTHWAGIPAYFADYRLLDAYGYNDRAAARRPLDPAVGWRAYRPGHKPPDVAALLDRRPDAFFQLWDVERLPVRRPRHHLRARGYVPVRGFWLRADSPYVELPPAR